MKHTYNGHIPKKNSLKNETLSLSNVKFQSRQVPTNALTDHCFTNYFIIMKENYRLNSTCFL